MKNTKTHSVVMLPTEKAEVNGLCEGGKPRQLFLMSRDNVKDYTNNPIYKKVCEENSQWVPKIICVLSNDDINFGDYFYSPAYRSIRQSAMNKYNGEGCKKIIACTDKEITPNSWIPESFVLAYIKAYREGNPIKEIDLEMIKVVDTEKQFDGKIVDYGTGVKPKTRPDGSAIIHQSKTYSREEVEDLIYSAMKSRNYTPLLEYREWISENL